MNLQEYIKKYGNIEVEEKQLNELLGIKESKLWKPQIGDTYYLIMSDGEITKTVWYGNCYDGRNWLVGNVYRTEEEAEFAVEKRKVEVELQRFAAEHNGSKLDLNNEKQPKYYIYFNAKCKEMGTNCCYVFYQNNIFFISDKIAEQAIQTIGEDRLKKYYFGVID